MLAVLLLTQTAISQPEVTLTRVKYREWVNSIRLSNGSIEAIYVPQIGRLMRYARVGGRNWLWENKSELKTAGPDWSNYGGDKLWVAPQSLWGWPPDPVLDGSPVEVTVKGATINVKGLPSAKSGVQFFRSISMDPRSGDLNIKNQMENITALKIERSLWEVAQLDDPEFIRVKLSPSKLLPEGWNTYDKQDPDPLAYTVTKSELIVRRHPSKYLKYGASSRDGTLQADFGTDTFEMQARYDSRATYPDEGRAQQIYTNGGDNKYVELELVSALVLMKPKQMIRLDVRWGIRSRDRRPNGGG